MTLSRKRGAVIPQMWDGSPFRILALDPGGTTGWAYCEFLAHLDDNYVLELQHFKFESGHLGPGDHHLTLWSLLLDAYGNIPNAKLPLIEVVCESFQFRQHINKDQAKTKVELMSVEYIGIVKLFAQVHNITPTWQTASAAKTLIPDKGPQSNVKLRQLGVYKPVTHWVHAMDAMRHLLRYMVAVKKVRSPITDAWLGD